MLLNVRVSIYRSPKNTGIIQKLENTTNKQRKIKRRYIHNMKDKSIPIAHACAIFSIVLSIQPSTRCASHIQKRFLQWNTVMKRKLANHIEANEERERKRCVCVRSSAGTLFISLSMPQQSPTEKLENR